MKSKKTFLSIMARSCVYYTVISLALLFLDLILNGPTSGALTVTVSLLALPTSVCLSLGDLVRKATSIPRWVGQISHYLITILSIFLFLCLPANPGILPVKALLIFVLLSVLYWLTAGIVILVRRRIRRLMEED